MKLKIQVTEEMTNRIKSFGKEEGTGFRAEQKNWPKKRERKKGRHSHDMSAV